MEGDKDKQKKKLQLGSSSSNSVSEKYPLEFGESQIIFIWLLRAPYLGGSLQFLPISSEMLQIDIFLPPHVQHAML